MDSILYLNIKKDQILLKADASSTDMFPGTTFAFYRYCNKEGRHLDHSQFLRASHLRAHLIQQAKPAPQEHVVVKKRHIPIKKILMLGIIATVVAVAYVSADTFELLDTNTVPIFKFSVNTDATNYRIGDIISVYGNAKESVKVSVLDASFNIIWFEEITPDSMDSYSVLVIADGDGWDAGEYTIMASYGADSDTVKITVQ